MGVRASPGSHRLVKLNFDLSMKLLIALVLLNIGIVAWEKYKPIPNPEQEQFETYVSKATYYSKVTGVPVEILIFLKIDTLEKLKTLIKHYPHLRGTTLNTWIDGISPRLGWRERLTIKKYEQWNKNRRKQTNQKSKITKNRN